MAWWFNRKSQNRRLKPQGELSTKAARRQALTARWRTASLALAAAYPGVIIGWTQQDEPDNAQPVERWNKDEAAIRKADPNHMILGCRFAGRTPRCACGDP